MEFEITSYRARNYPLWKIDKEGGCGEARIQCRDSEVHLFTYDGSVALHESDPFTTLEMYWGGEVHSARLPRCYHERWWPRLAFDFEWQVRKSNEGQK